VKNIVRIDAIINVFIGIATVRIATGKRDSRESTVEKILAKKR
jgi:hypothetical protein